MSTANEKLIRAMSAAVAVLQSEFPGTVCQLIVAETPTGQPSGQPFTIGAEDIYLVTTGMDSNEMGLLELAMARVAASRGADTVLVPPQGGEEH